MLRYFSGLVRYRHFLIWSLLGLTLAYLSFPFIRLHLSASQFPTPQGILMLGGGVGRETFTAEFARDHADLPIWVSTGVPPSVARSIFSALGIEPPRLILDYRAVDTLTNFTSLVEDFQAQGIRHLYLITSADHMPRARVVASIVLGSRGIAFTPVPIPPHTSHDSGSHESFLRIARDGVRAYGWLLTKRTGATITLRVHPERRRMMDEQSVLVSG